MHNLHFSFLGCRELSCHSVIMVSISGAMSSCIGQWILLPIFSEVSMIWLQGDVPYNQKPSLPSMAQHMGIYSHVFYEFVRLGNTEVSCIVINAAKRILQWNHNWRWIMNDSLKNWSHYHGCHPGHLQRQKRRTENKSRWLGLIK